MTMDTFDRGLGRTLHLMGGLFALAVMTTVAYIAGSWVNETPWPYDVWSRRLLTEEVTPGGKVILERVVDYHDDCNIRYERRVQSSLPAGRRFIPEDQEFEHPPWDRSRKAQETATLIPVDFPCGPAYLVETVSVACNTYQRLVQRRRKPDIITPFFVTGCAQ